MARGRLGIGLALVSLAPLLLQCGESDTGKPAAMGGTASGGTASGGTASGGTASGGTAEAGGAGTSVGAAGSGGGGAGAIAGYANFGGHTSGCLTDPCRVGGCGDPCIHEQCKTLPICQPTGGGEGSGGESAGGAGGQSSAPPPPPATITACYQLPGYDDAACLPADDALSSWLALPRECAGHVLRASNAHPTPRSCCYRVSCTP